MQYRVLGATGLRVSEIATGTAQLSNVDGRYTLGKPIPANQARDVLAAAVDQGITLFDTGSNYGDAELLLGQLGIPRRSGIVVATKAGMRDDGVRDFSPRYLEACIDASRKRLNVDRLDLFQLNKPSADILSDGRLDDFLAEQKSRGAIAHAGIVVGLLEAGEVALQSKVLDCLQIMNNLTDNTTDGLIRRAAEAGKGILVRSPLASGLLSGSYSAHTVFSPEDERALFFKGEEFLQRLAAVRELQDELGIVDGELLEFALVYLLSKPGIGSVLVGASTLEQIHRYAAISHLPRLDGATLAKVGGVIDRTAWRGRNQFSESGDAALTRSPMI